MDESTQTWIGEALVGIPSLVRDHDDPTFVERQTPLLDAASTNAGAPDGCPTML